MGANAGNIHYHLHEMVGGPAGSSDVQVIYRSADGILICYGTTVPTDAATGYAPGCIFIHVDGTTLTTTLYQNVGSATSCNFDSLIGITQGAHVTDPAACAAMTATLTGVDTGTDMTAAQAATIVADLSALKTAIDANATAIKAILSRLETAGILATS